ncbi:MAG TPA: SDR family NAD(P)-dependent oxidoreductase [Acidimicrobiales bacterium]|nr:SDR family NAD(P)-dependent oxidoreductase [Acidimicrobiales bacterium]
MTLRYDGRVAIVTGSGGNPSLGRAHARLLASRGAKLVINDINKDPDDVYYKDTAAAQAVADEIVADGGEAVADTHSVATWEGASAVVATAVEAFGRVDILVNNAGICPINDLDKLSELDITRTIGVNLMGTIWMTRAVWPHMVGAGYGRIVNIPSGALTGFPKLAIYGASKGGVFSFTRAMALEGAEHGIKVNSVSPAAYTRMIIAMQEPGSKLLETLKEGQPAELVSPAVALLAHEDCPINGENLNAMGGRVSHTFLSETKGIMDPDLTIESLQAALDDVLDRTDAVVWVPGSVGAASDLSASDLVDKAST